MKLSGHMGIGYECVKVENVPFWNAKFSPPFHERHYLLLLDVFKMCS